MRVEEKHGIEKVIWGYVYVEVDIRLLNDISCLWQEQIQLLPV